MKFQFAQFPVGKISHPVILSLAFYFVHVSCIIMWLPDSSYCTYPTLAILSILNIHLDIIGS